MSVFNSMLIFEFQNNFCGSKYVSQEPETGANLLL